MDGCWTQQAGVPTAREDQTPSSSPIDLYHVHYSTRSPTSGPRFQFLLILTADPIPWPISPTPPQQPLASDGGPLQPRLSDVRAMWYEASAIHSSTSCNQQRGGRYGLAYTGAAGTLSEGAVWYFTGHSPTVACSSRNGDMRTRKAMSLA